MEEVYRTVVDSGSHLYCFNHPDKPWQTMELVERCEALFDQAESTAPDETVLYRVRKERMAVRYLRILLTPKGSVQRNALLASFEQDVKTFGLTQIWERGQSTFACVCCAGRKNPVSGGRTEGGNG